MHKARRKRTVEQAPFETPFHTPAWEEQRRATGQEDREAWHRRPSNGTGRRLRRREDGRRTGKPTRRQWRDPARTRRGAAGTACYDGRGTGKCGTAVPGVGAGHSTVGIAVQHNAGGGKGRCFWACSPRRRGVRDWPAASLPAATARPRTRRSTRSLCTSRRGRKHAHQPAESEARRLGQLLSARPPQRRVPQGRPAPSSAGAALVPPQAAVVAWHGRSPIPLGVPAPRHQVAATRPVGRRPVATATEHRG